MRGAVPCEERVRRDGRPVDDQLDLAEQLLERNAEPTADLLQPGDEAERRVGRRRARLVHEPHVASAEDEEVGERAADVDSDPVAHARSLAVSASSIPLRSAKQRDAVARTRLLGREQAVAHLLEDQPGVAAMGVAVAAAAAVARFADRPRRDVVDDLLGAPLLDRAVGEVQPQLVQPGRLAAEQPRRRVGALGRRRRRRSSRRARRSRRSASGRSCRARRATRPPRPSPAGTRTAP